MTTTPWTLGAAARSDADQAAAAGGRAGPVLQPRLRRVHETAGALALRVHRRGGERCAPRPRRPEGGERREVHVMSY